VVSLTWITARCTPLFRDAAWPLAGPYEFDDEHIDTRFRSPVSRGHGSIRMKAVDLDLAGVA